MDSRFGLVRSVTAVFCVVLMVVPAGLAQAPEYPALQTPDAQQAVPLLSPDQLNNLVAPIALYPDPLLGQVLSASTYPLEVVQAQQWLGQNGNLQGAQLMEAAKQQNWDPSVQALVMFPNALALLANDIRWTTDLGNAFLAQQADVMGAVQTMRARARANGRLTNTPQQVVTMASQEGQDAIEIQPADPQIMYVPVYSPSYVWGPPAYGAYPDLWYPDGFSYGFGFGPGYYMGSYFSNWGGWGGWGWGCGWFGRSLFVNSGFFNRYRFRDGGYGHSGWFGGGRGFAGRGAWTHNPGHRMGVPYPNRNVAGRFGGGQWNRGRGDSGRNGFSQSNGFSQGAGGRGNRSQASGGWQRFNGGNSAGQPNARGFAQSGDSRFRSNNRGDSGSFRGAPNNPGAGDSRGFNPGRRGSVSAPNQNYSAPRSFSSPRNFDGGGRSRSNSAPSQNYSAPQSFGSARNYGGGGGSSRSYSAPSQNPARQSFGSPRNFINGSGPSRSYSAPSQNSAPRSIGSPRGFGGGGGAPSRSYSAPSQSHSAPRSAPSQGGGGSSRGNAGSSGGHSQGHGGGHRR